MAGPIKQRDEARRRRHADYFSFTGRPVVVVVAVGLWGRRWGCGCSRRGPEEREGRERPEEGHRNEADMIDVEST